MPALGFIAGTAAEPRATKQPPLQSQRQRFGRCSSNTLLQHPCLQAPTYPTQHQTWAEGPTGQPEEFSSLPACKTTRVLGCLLIDVRLLWLPFLLPPHRAALAAGTIRVPLAEGVAGLMRQWKEQETSNVITRHRN